MIVEPEPYVYVYSFCFSKEIMQSPGSVKKCAGMLVTVLNKTLDAAYIVLCSWSAAAWQSLHGLCSFSQCVQRSCSHCAGSSDLSLAFRNNLWLMLWREINNRILKSKDVKTLSVTVRINYMFTGSSKVEKVNSWAKHNYWVVVWAKASPSVSHWHPSYFLNSSSVKFSVCWAPL